MFRNIINTWNKKKLTNLKYSYLFDPCLENEYVSLDCETTGLNPNKDEILSIGAVIVKGNKILMRDTFNIFVKPSSKIAEASIKIHQIRPIDLVNAVDSKVAITQLLDFIGSRTIIGYYIKFDMTIISKYTKKYIKKLQKNSKKTEFLNFF